MKNRWSLLSYVLGLALLVWLILRSNPALLWSQLVRVGPWVALPFASYLPATLARTLALHALLPKAVKLRQLLPIQLISEAFSRIIPLAGLGGEPYRRGQLKTWLEPAEATRAVVQDRLVHAQSGLLFTALSVPAMLATTPIEPRLRLLCLLLSLGCLTAVLVMAAIYLGKLRILPSKWARTLAWKQVADFLSLLEMACLFWVLGLPVSLAPLLAVAAMIEISAVVFVFVPSGVGVNEAGIVAAFALTGLPTELGVAYGLLRRGRILFWALVGMALYAQRVRVRELPK